MVAVTSSYLGKLRHRDHLSSTPCPRSPRTMGTPGDMDTDSDTHP